MARQCGDQDVATAREPCQTGWYEFIAHRHSGALFLDVGAGLGVGCAYLEWLSHGEAVGIDIDQNLARFGVNVPKLPLLENSYDVVCCCDVIEHVENPQALMRTLLRVARQAVYVTTPNFNRSKCSNPYHVKEWTIDEFRKEFNPSEIWVASPDGWHNRQLLTEGRPMNWGSPDGMQWAHFCAIFNKSEL